jgi:hypothetical protein
MKSTIENHRRPRPNDNINIRVARELRDLRRVESLFEQTYAAAGDKPDRAHEIARKCRLLLIALDVRVNRLESMFAEA